MLLKFWMSFSVSSSKSSPKSSLYASLTTDFGDELILLEYFEGDFVDSESFSTLREFFFREAVGSFSVYLVSLFEVGRPFSLLGAAGLHFVCSKQPFHFSPVLLLSNPVNLFLA